MILRDATRKDAAAIAALHAANWRESYRGIVADDFLDGPVEEERRGVWKDRLAKGDTDQDIVLALNDRDELLGFACIYHAHDPRWGGFLDNLHTAAAVRGAGYGQALLREAGRRIAARDPSGGLYLWVFEKNHAARRFYRSMGAQEVEHARSEWDRAQDQWCWRCHWAQAAALSQGAG